MGDGVCVHERTRGEMGGRHHLLMLPRKDKIIRINVMKMDSGDTF